MIQDLFAECLKVPSDEWESRLLQLCPNDAEMRQSVLELLLADSENQASDFLNKLRPTDDSTASRTETLPFEELGGYQIIRQIGQGSFGVVYQARRSSQSCHVDPKPYSSPQEETAQTTSDRIASSAPGPIACDEGFPENTQLFAIKVLHPWLRDKRSLNRFAAEARALRFLDDPHIAKFVEDGVEGDIRFIVMEYVHGHGMSECLRNSSGDYDVSQVPLATRIEWFYGVCQGVAAAHQHLILHRDLKPSNVLIENTGRAIVTDFGLAKFLDPSPQGIHESVLPMTGTGQSPGTLMFMAPEQLDGSDELCLATDVYGLGATLYFLLTGRPPYPGRSAVELCHAIRSGPPPSVTQIDRNVPKDLEAICFKCLSAVPRRRYQTAQALGEDIGRFQASEPITARRVSQAESFIYWARRNPITSALAVGLLASVVIGLTLISILWIQAERNFETAQASRADLLETIKEVTGHLKLVEGDPKTLSLQREMLLSIAKGYDRLAAYSQLEQRQANNRGVAWFKLGRVENQLGDLRAKDAAYSNAERVFREQLDREPANVEWLFDHFHALTSLDRHEDALVAIEKVIAADESNNVQYEDALSNALLELATEKLAKHELDEASLLADRGFAISSRLNEVHANDPRFLRKLAQQHYLQFELAVSRRDITGVSKHLSAACELIQLAHQRNSGDAGVQIEVIRFCHMMARLKSVFGDVAETERYLDIADQVTQKFYNDYPTFVDAWHQRAISLQWRLTHLWIIGDQEKIGDARSRLETFFEDRIAEKPECPIANMLLAMFIASPMLQDDPDLDKANQLLEIAKRNYAAGTLDHPQSILHLWSGDVEGLKASVEQSPLLLRYVRAIEAAEFEPPGSDVRDSAKIDVQMIWDYLTTDLYLFPQGFYRDIKFARAKREERRDTALP